MTTPTTVPALSEDLEAKARRQLARILASRTFHQADRLKRFIAFIVEETLAGRGNQLKEFVLGLEVFGKDARFDPRTDPLVRVQARRLRLRLASYYLDEGQEDEILFAVQERVAMAVAEKLAAGIPSGQAAKGRESTENLTAYNLCLQGRYHTGQRTEEGLRLAIECFERAIVEDELCVEAHCGLRGHPIFASLASKLGFE